MSMSTKGAAVWIDGTLVVLIAIFIMVQTIFSSEEAYKYLNPYLLFWIKATVGVLGAGAGALKGFRSVIYSESRTEKALQDTGNTDRFEKPQPKDK